MSRHYSSFLLRVDPAGHGKARFMIEHIQSGERATHSSPDEVRAWIREQAGSRPAPAARPPAGRPARPGGARRATTQAEPSRGSMSVPCDRPAEFLPEGAPSHRRNGTLARV